MDESRLAQVAEALGEDAGQPVLDRMVKLSVDMLSLSGAGIAVIVDGQHRGSVAVSDAAHAAVDDLQFELGEGPCLDADRSMRPVLEPDLASASGRWPAFAPAAVALGMRAVFALPLQVGAVRVGVLNLYRDSSTDLESGDLADAIALSRVATHLVLELEAGLTPGMLPERLAETLDSRARVHQATGMIAAQLASDVATALSRLRAHAWANNRPVDDVAGDVVARRLKFDQEKL